MDGASNPSCTLMYTPVPRRRAPCSAGARDILKTASEVICHKVVVAYLGVEVWVSLYYSCL
jgi:hypothetical protein